jgi:hypothetical protein
MRSRRTSSKFLFKIRFLGLVYSRNSSEECVDSNAAPERACNDRPSVSDSPRGHLVDFISRVVGRLRYFLIVVSAFLAAVTITFALNAYVPLPVDFQSVFLLLAITILLGNIVRLT